MFFGLVATLFVYFYSKNVIYNNEKENLEIVIKKAENEMQNSFDFISTQAKKISEDEDLLKFIKKTCTISSMFRVLFYDPKTKFVTN